MTRNTHSLPSSMVQSKEPPSLIARIRQGHGTRPARTGTVAQDAYLPANTDADATKAVTLKISPSTAYQTDIPPLETLIRRVRSYPKDRLIKEREVLATIGRSKAAMRRDVSLGLFVAPIKTGVKSSAWRESEVMGWVEATTILSRVGNPGFTMQEFVAATMVSRIPMC